MTHLSTHLAQPFSQAQGAFALAAPVVPVPGIGNPERCNRGNQTARSLINVQATPARGACTSQGRGCSFLVTFLVTGLLAGLGWSGASAAQQSVPVPSGQPVALAQVLVDEQPGETWVRFRFIAPQIARDGGSIDFDTATADIEHLCQDLVLPYLAEAGLAPSRVIISLSDRAVEFGSADPDATQFFEAYKPQGGICIWEEF